MKNILDMAYQVWYNAFAMDKKPIFRVVKRLAAKWREEANDHYDEPYLLEQAADDLEIAFGLREAKKAVEAKPPSGLVERFWIDNIWNAAATHSLKHMLMDDSITHITIK